MKRIASGLRSCGGEEGQALVLVLGLAAALMLGTLALAGFGQALGGKARHQRGADLAAVTAARSMQADYPRLFEAEVLENGLPNPRHLSRATYVARARAAAVRAGRRNRVRVLARDVAFPHGFAPTRVSVRVRGNVRIRVAARRRDALRRLAVRARATAELSPPAGGGPGMPAYASGGDARACRHKCPASAWRRKRSSGLR